MISVSYEWNIVYKIRNYSKIITTLIKICLAYEYIIIIAIYYATN